MFLKLRFLFASGPCYNSRYMEIIEYVKERKALLKNEVALLKAKPVLVIVQVNEDYASDKYIKGKLNDALEVGIEARHIKLSVSTTEEELLKLIDKLNEQTDVHGIIVQLPLPSHISEDKVKARISVKKDVDGFNPLSPFKACTPLGIINYLKAEKIVFRGKNALVIGRSNIVGRPMADLLINEDATVTVAHSKTAKEDLAFYLKHADIIVVAVGKAHFIDKQLLKEDAVIVDVGINRGSDGFLKGDARPGLKVRLQTPVPGGVGLLTRLTLLENVWEGYKHGI